MIDFKSIFKTKNVTAIVPTEWLSTLADLEDIEALKLSIKHLSQTLEAVQQDGIEPAHLHAHLDLLISLEEHNQSRLARLAQQYSSIESLKPELEKAMRANCYDYCRLSYICHLKIIDKVIDPAKYKLEGNLPVLLIARAFYIAFNMLKWRMFEHANPPPNVWLQIFALYGIAQKQMLHTVPIELFKLSPASTINAYLVQLSMFGQLANSHFPKLHIENAYQILTALVTQVRISADGDTKLHTFFINPNKDAPAARLRDIDISKEYRYWDLNTLESEINEGIKSTEQGHLPHKLSLLKVEQVKRLNETFKILNQEWGKLNYARQRRKEDRKSSSRTMLVNSGFAQMCEHIFKANQHAQGLAYSLDDRLRHHTIIRQAGVETERAPKNIWQIINESAHGLGAQINTNDPNLAKPDKLISLSFSDEPNKVLIGKIRTNSPVASHSIKVGIEILSQRPVWAQLRLISSPSLFNQPSSQSQIEKPTKILGHGTIDSGLFSGIYLPIEAGFIEQSVLLLPKLSFFPNAEYEINAKGISNKILLGNAIESYDDWVKVLVNFG
jgi:hypothetical protein